MDKDVTKNPDKSGRELHMGPHNSWIGCVTWLESHLSLIQAVMALPTGVVDPICMCVQDPPWRLWRGRAYIFTINAISPSCWWISRPHRSENQQMNIVVCNGEAQRHNHGFVTRKNAILLKFSTKISSTLNCIRVTQKWTGSRLNIWVRVQ